MKRQVLVDPITDDVNEIVWHNLKQSDENYNLQVFIAASTAWLKLNPTKSYQDLEKELRDRDFNTHLIAKKSILKENYLIIICNDYKCENFEYECIFSCRPKQSALNELLATWKSYDENFEKLAYTGNVCIDNNNPLNINDRNKTIILNDQMKNLFQLIENNKKMVLFKDITVEEILNDLINDIKDKYGKDPEHKLFGMTSNGGPIMVLTVDNSIVSDVAYTIEYTKFENNECQKVIKLINLVQ
jgi:hypothetical protein